MADVVVLVVVVVVVVVIVVVVVVVVVIVVVVVVLVVVEDSVKDVVDVELEDGNGVESQLVEEPDNLQSLVMTALVPTCGGPDGFRAVKI